MGFAENVLNKVRGTPTFKPASVDSFGNWAIEAGDIITVENDGVTESIPIFSSDMNWNGSAQTTISCTGNQKREIQDKQTRKDNAMSSGLASYTDERLDELSESFGVALDDVSAGMNAYVKRVQKKDADGNPIVDENGNPVWEDWSATADVFAKTADVQAGLGLVASSDDFDKIKKAGTTLYAQIPEKARAEIAAYAWEDDKGNTHTVAQILADLIKLQGDTEILGDLSIKDGKLWVSKGITSENAVTGASVYANGTGDQGIVSGRRLVGLELAINGNEYTPKEITSTTGAVLALGYA